MYCSQHHQADSAETFSVSSSAYCSASCVFSSRIHSRASFDSFSWTHQHNTQAHHRDWHQTCTASHAAPVTRQSSHSQETFLHDELHWLDVPDRVFLKLTVTVHRCLNGRAPPYLSDYCVPVAGADTRRHLRSINRQLLAVPRYWLNTYGRRVFSTAGPTVWNSLSDFIWDPTLFQTSA